MPKYYVTAMESRHITVEVEAANEEEVHHIAPDIIFQYDDSAWDYGEDFEIYDIQEAPEEPEDLPLATHEVQT